MRDLNFPTPALVKDSRGFTDWLGRVRSNFVALSTLRAAVVVQGALDFASLAADGGTDDQTIAAADVAEGDAVIVTPPATADAGVVFHGWVSAAGQVTVRATNTTSGAKDLASGQFTVAVLGKE